MKYITIFLIFLSIYGSQCPNLCSGHGTCNSNGMCNCYPQWMEGDCSQRTCPYGIGVADPNGHDTKHDLECSGQGVCDRTTGTCQCFNGFGGSSCERVLCPNDCNGHGVCTQTSYLSIDTDTYYYDQYINSDRIVNENDFVNNWDSNVIYTCLCDPEYTGFDCGQKKCKVGYQQTSYCDVPSQYVQEILIYGNIEGCLAHANYTDSFGRSWITRPFNIFKETGYPDISGNTKGLQYDTATNCNIVNSKYPSFKEALESLPAGVIDIESIDFKPFKTGDSAIILQIKFGSQQTGKQSAIKILQDKDFTNEDNLPHGVYKLEKINQESISFPLDATISNQETTYIPPTECANNGYCNRQSGICECFDGFFGDACTEIVPVILITEMKYLQIFLFALAAYGAQCPNLCSSHGSCNANGLCNCYPGWTEGDCSSRTCPYGERVADPDGHNEENFLECSGQGKCNRVSGECECYPGFAGSACHRTECVNQCSGHGVCTKVGYLGIEYNTYFDPFYADGNYKLDTYNTWDKESMYTCVCDKEYTGYDCSQRKCATGYKETSECDVSSIYTQTIALAKKQYTVKTTPRNNLDGCIAYAEYTDTFNRTWYTRPFNIFKDMPEDQYKKYEDIDNNNIECGKYTPQFPSFLEALKTLPSGTIDVRDVTFEVDGDNVLIYVTYGSQQTGRQYPIRIVTAEDYPLFGALQGDDQYCADVPQVKKVTMYPIPNPNSEKEIDDANTAYLAEINKKYTCPGSGANSDVCTEDDITVSYLHAYSTTLKTTYIPPLECANNGLCDRTSGLCQCFEGYYGLACTEATPVV